MKTVYWLSYRIAKKGDYDERYGALNDMVKAIAETAYWDETTSFFVFDSSKDIDAIATSVEGALNTSWDLALLRKMDAKGARIIGSPDDEDIFKLMDYLQYA